MKRTLLFLFIVIVVVKAGEDQKEEEEDKKEKDKFDEWVKDVSNFLLLSEKQIQTCINETGVEFGDLEHARQAINDSEPITGCDDSIWKVGYMFDCLQRKRKLFLINTVEYEVEYTNLDTIRENLKKLLHFNKEYVLKHVSVYSQVIDSCADQVTNEIADCVTTTKFVLCHPFYTHNLQCTASGCPTNHKFCWQTAYLKSNETYVGPLTIYRIIPNVDIDKPIED